MSHSLSPEEQIILLLARVNPSPTALEEAGSLLKDNPVDFTKMVRSANMSGVSPLLYHNLKSLGGIPEKTMEEFRNAYLFTVKENIGNAAEMKRILMLLKMAGVEAIPLKGAIASDVILGNPGLYPAGDLDMLVRPSDLEGAKRALMDAGYKESDAMDEEDMLRSSYHLLFQQGRNVVEVHWKLAFRYFDIPADFWWEDVRGMEYEGVQMPALSAERYVLYTIFRLYSHAFRPLRFFVLIAEIINKYEKELDWPKLISCARKYKMERLVLFTLKLLNELLECPAPEEVVKRRFSGYHSLKRLVLSGLFQDIKKIHTRMLLFTALQQTPLDTLKVLSQRVFPPLSEVRLRYRLPAGSKKIYAYYLFNPVLLLLRKR